MQLCPFQTQRRDPGAGFSVAGVYKNMPVHQLMWTSVHPRSTSVLLTLFLGCNLSRASLFVQLSGSSLALALTL